MTWGLTTWRFCHTTKTLGLKYYLHPYKER